MKSFEDFDSLQQYHINLVMPLTMLQEECPPELFAPMADSFLKQYKESLRLFNIEHNFKQQQREAKYRYRLLKKGWRKRIRRELSSEDEAVKFSAESEQSERINSAAVYAQPLDSAIEPAQLGLQIEADKGSICLISPNNAEDANPED